MLSDLGFARAKNCAEEFCQKNCSSASPSSKMYSAHRTQNSAIPSDRLNDLFEQLKSEYVAMENELNLCKMQRDNFEQKCLPVLIFYRTNSN